MNILRDLSLIWSLIHILILFIFFYESRYTRKTVLILSCLFMIPLGVLNIAGVIMLGPELMGQLIMFTITLPSGIFFYIMAKNRNFKFLFTFAVVDTVSYEIVVITKILDFYIGGDKYILMLILRLLAFPLMELIAYKYLRRPYIKIQNSVKSGWGIFTGISFSFYILILLLANFPTWIVARPWDLPAMAVLLFLCPFSYFGIAIALRKQMALLDSERREQTLTLQTTALEQRLEQTASLENEMRIQRHDMHHKYNIIAEMVKVGKNAEALEYINAMDAQIDCINPRKFCCNPIIDAVFGYFARKADANNIRLGLSLSIPESLDLNVSELSVVLSNVLENAINANLALPEDKRYIECISVSSPQFMFQICNPFVGQIELDENNLPVTNKAGHGTGVRSILAFCEKHDVYSEFKIEDGVFYFRMAK